jgi:CheY-like chemotaxis protein
LRILLAEDNAVNRQVAQLTLARLGYEADAVENGLEALEVLRAKSYDLVLMDIEMPEMDGLEASRRIHAEWNAEERPRIVAMTANAMPGDREMCLAAGMDDYLSKPIRSEELAAALDRSRPGLAPEPADQGGGELVDQEALMRLREATGDEEFVNQLVETFLEEAPSLLKALSEAIGSGDVVSLRRTAHTLKSNARTFGAERLGTRCQELEALARSGAIGEDAERLERGIKHDLADVSAELRRTVAG